MDDAPYLSEFTKDIELVIFTGKYNALCNCT